MKGNENYKQKLEAILDYLKEEDKEIYESALEISRKNYIDKKDLEYMLSSSETTATLDENDVFYYPVFYRRKPKILVGVADGLVVIPCTSYTDGSYELNLDDMIVLNHEDLRELVSETEKYREDIHKISGEYELEMVVMEHGGAYPDFD